MSDDTIILHEMVPKWNRLFKQKGEFRKIRWCKVHDAFVGRVEGPDANEGKHCEAWEGRLLLLDENFTLSECVIVDKWLES